MDPQRGLPHHTAGIEAKSKTPSQRKIENCRQLVDDVSGDVVDVKYILFI